MVPGGIDLAEVTRDELVAAYLDQYDMDRETAELYADLILDPDRDVPLI